MPHALVSAISNIETVRRTGRIVQYCGMAVESAGPDVFIGEICEIVPLSGGPTILAETVGFQNGHVLLLPCGSVTGLQVGSRVIATGKQSVVKVGKSLIGRVLDGFGNPIDGLGPIDTTEEYKVQPGPANPLHREKIQQQVETGIKVIDGFFPIGKGQRMGIFAGSGVGKSTLLGQITSSAQSDISVIALIGERGREALEFVEEILGDNLSQCVVVVAGADQPALVRTHAAYTALAISEYFCDQGLDVLLTMDSITRFAMAQREIGLAIGEPPTTRGYTPSTFDRIPKLMERAGNFRNKGSITGIFTVLVEGDDFNEPVSDHVRAILDGHIVLDRSLANAGMFPAIHVLHSTSRLAGTLMDQKQSALISRAISLLALHEESRDLLELGGYEVGTNPELDKAVVFAKDFKTFRQQKFSEPNAKQKMMDYLEEKL